MPANDRYKTTLICQVVVIDEDKHTACFFNKSIVLPFAPFPGLELDLGEDISDGFDIKQVRWYHPEERFYVECEPDIQDNRTDRHESLEDIIGYYTDNGWTKTAEEVSSARGFIPERPDNVDWDMI